MSNYIVEAFKKMALLESEDISLDADGLDKLSGFMDEAGVDPDEESVDVYDLEAEAQDDLKDSYIGKVVCECSVCHSHVFFDKTDMSEDADADADGLVCYDIECPYCMSNEGYILIGEIAPYNQEESDELQNPDEAEDEEEIPAVDVEGAADDVDEEDLEESLNEQKLVKESWEEEFEAEYDSIQDDPSLSEEQKKEYLKKLFAEFSMNEELKLDGVEELYDNDEIRGDESLEGVDELEGVEELHGDKHEAPISESRKPRRGKRSLKEGREDFDKIAQALDKASKNNSNLLISNRPGNGTINAIKEWCKNNRRVCRIVDCLTLDPEDISGAIVRKGSTSDRRQSQLMSEIEKLDENSVLVLNEMSRVSNEVMGALLSVVQKAPCIVVATMNNGDSIDPAMKSRFLKVSVNESRKSRRGKRSIKEDIEDVSVTTSDETMTMTTKEDGGVVIETSPVEEPIDEMPVESEDEMIVPLSDESSDEIDAAIDANSVEEGEDAIDMEELEEEPEDEFDEFDDFDEESFNGLGESYLRSCYENVSSFKTTGASVDGKKLIIEGMIKFDSGNIKETEFVFESLGKGKFEGYNKQISRGKKTYRLNTSVKNHKLVCEALNYNYRSRNELNESVRVYGTVKRK